MNPQEITFVRDISWLNQNLFYAQGIANYFLSRVDEESGDNLSNLKLQKLVYYAQAFHLAMRQEPLFRESIEAWRLGPVVPGLYETYRYQRAKALEPPDHLETDNYPPEVREIIDAVLANYAQFSASRLMRMTQSEPTWAETPLDQEIPRSLLRDFFANVVEASSKGESYADEPVWPSNSFQFQRRTEIVRRAPARERLRAAREQTQAESAITVPER